MASIKHASSADAGKMVYKSSSMSAKGHLKITGERNNKGFELGIIQYTEGAQGESAPIPLHQLFIVRI